MKQPNVDNFGCTSPKIGRNFKRFCLSPMQCCHSQKKLVQVILWDHYFSFNIFYDASLLNMLSHFMLTFYWKLKTSFFSYEHLSNWLKLKTVLLYLVLIVNYKCLYLCIASANRTRHKIYLGLSLSWRGSLFSE